MSGTETAVDCRVEIRDGPLVVGPPDWALEDSGSRLSFEGVVRPLEDGRPIRGIRYETYDPMASRMLEELARQVAGEFGLRAIRVLHSRGMVGAGECSFRLDVASPHRRESIDALDRFVTRMKEDVPIWKHPIGSAETRSDQTGLGDPARALSELLGAIHPVGETEEVDLEHASGRVLARPILQDRDSPPADVSAMDGFALRLEDRGSGWIPVHAEAEIGEAIRSLPAGVSMKIFTGAPIPDGADLVVRREDVEEGPAGEIPEGADAARSAEAGGGWMRLRVDPAELDEGRHIRRRGENGKAGDRVLDPGTLLSAPMLGALGAFGVARPVVRRRVRVAVIVTGNELVPVDREPGPTQIRDSNGWALRGILGRPWLELVSRVRARDQPADVRDALDDAIEAADAVVLTGGVSMGDHDHVPAAVEALGGTIHFHRLAIKPGKPVLGATVRGGKVVMGLPGNPVSVLATARRFLLPALRRLAGLEPGGSGLVRLVEPLPRSHPLTRFLPIEWAGPGLGRVIPSRGSGDLVAAARSTGLVEIPAGASGSGPWSFLPWEES